MAAAYQVDPGNVCITETSLVSGEQRSEDDLLASATRAAKALFAELLKLPKKTKAGRNGGQFDVVELPVPLDRRPREKAAPKEKPMTAWEKYALKKGIKLNRKKNNKEWNDARQEWQDKWGKRARDRERQSDWIREVPANYVAKEDGGDPFLDDKREKKVKLSRDKKNAERNQRRTEALAKARAEADSIDRTVSRLATASMGKFDKSSGKAGKKRSK